MKTDTNKLIINGIEISERGYYINLDSSTDRKERVESQIEKYNIKGLNRFEALTDPFIQYSCTKSHLSIFQKCLEDNVETVMIFEDDFQIYDECKVGSSKIPFLDALTGVINDMNNVEWDVVLFGCTPRTYLIPITKNLALNSKSTGGWAYVIKKRAYKFLLENSNYKKDLIAIDDYLPLLNRHGFISLSTIPLVIHHGTNLVSTLQPRGPVNYNTLIEGSYDAYLFDHVKLENIVECYEFERETTIVILGHFVDNFLFYLRYLLHSIPKEIEKCRFMVIYDTNHNKADYKNRIILEDYFKNRNKPINYEILYSNGGLIDSVRIMLEKIKTKYFLFLEHDWVFLKNEKIEFNRLLDTFNKYPFVHAVWFNKDDNQLRGYEIAGDVNKNETPFDKEHRIYDFDLVTTIRWSNNPSMLRTSKYKEWFEKYINNPFIGINHQGQYNVEDSMIREYRELISKSKFEDIKDDWGTYLYGSLGSGPYVGHTDGSRRYQTTIRTIAEDNADEYVKNNPLPEKD